MGKEVLLLRSEQGWGLAGQGFWTETDPIHPSRDHLPYKSRGHNGAMEWWMSEREKEKARRGGFGWGGREGRGGNNELQLNLDLTIRRPASHWEQTKGLPSLTHMNAETQGFTEKLQLHKPFPIIFTNKRTLVKLSIPPVILSTKYNSFHISNLLCKYAINVPWIKLYEVYDNRRIFRHLSWPGFTSHKHQYSNAQRSY